tara:strand:- start:250 stop:537 length:288 start_codon:yes stop_codon:yes gene_type:complete
VEERRDNLATLITARSTWLLDAAAPTERMVRVLCTHAIGVFRDKLTLPLKVSVVLVASLDDNVVVADVREDHFIFLYVFKKYFIDRIQSKFKSNF